MNKVHIALLALCMALFVCDGTSAGDGREGRPKVRAITAFISLSASDYKRELADTAQALNTAKKKFEERGWVVETIRITTQPFPEFVSGLPRVKALELLLELDKLAAGNYEFNVGPAMMKDSDDPAMMDLAAEFLARAKVTNSSAIIAADDGVHWETIQRAAHVVKYLSNHTPHGQGNFRFGATAMVAPYGPFYPASYHTAGGGKFAIGLESANVVLRVLSETKGGPQQAADKLSSELSRYDLLAEAVARDFAKQSGWEYLGLDPTPAPAGDVSIGAAMEAYTGYPVGSSGTLSTAFLITTAVRSVQVKQVGYAGLMLPVLEDETLAKRWSEGKLSIDALLSYSSVCATGLDTVPLPGDVTEDQIARILGDVAALASKWKKPLTARLLPVKNKSAGDRSDFDDAHLSNAKIQALP
ncbi:MAG: DUF711 family protein [Acidobacteriota bacterium]|nr:DUF711 family protein [Acidobacteriota bacterium]